MLNESRKIGRIAFVESPCIDAGRDKPENVGAVSLAIARRTVSMADVKPLQNAGPVQEIVHERIDHDHLAARLKPIRSDVRSGDQNR